MIKLTLSNSTELDKIIFIVNKDPYVVNRAEQINLELNGVDFIGVEATGCDGDFIEYHLVCDINFHCVQRGNKLKLTF